jgi:ribA/ribD-fused uncharacterized protein
MDLAAEAEEEEAAENGPVLFGGKGDDPAFRPLSNFSPAAFVLDGAEWPTVEHYYQAMKTEDAELREAIRVAPRPGKAKQMGRQLDLRAGWEEMKRDVMFAAVRAKFEQNEKHRALLESTGDREIHENRPDPVWGGGPNYPGGTDWLGEVLTDVRDLLRNGG